MTTHQRLSIISCPTLPALCPLLLALSSSEETALALDVLLDIMSFCDDTTVCRLIQADKSLHREGAKQLLSHDLITISTEDALDSLIHFLASRGGYRLVFLRGLGLNISYVGTPISRRFDMLLRRHSNHVRLQRIDIAYLEALERTSPSIILPLCRLKTLETARFNGAGFPITSSLLSIFHSNLTTIHIEWGSVGDVLDNPDFDPSDEYDFRNPILTLHIYLHTLQHLTAVNAVFQFKGNSSPVYADVYPHLTHLTLTNVNAPITAALARAYPNLTDLTITLHPYLSDDPQDSYILHEINSERQAAHGSWTALDSVTAPFRDLYMLAIPCPVRAVLITGPQEICFHVLRAVLEPARPRHLAFLHFDGGIFSEYMGHVLQEPLAAGVETLELHFDLSGRVLDADGAEIGAEEMVDGWVDAIAELPKLSTLSITVKWCSAEKAGEGTTRSPSEEYFFMLDLEDLAEELCDRIPTLKTLALAMSGLPGRLPASVSLARE
ncbi:uncharacterized protein BXZ73DRAFT_109533 [Epithele typhae]|uniref:uncharacterized protein n=1 Tax=Epithele typhae TaxID=378194 RepID=UPI002007D9A6|nr:uncharacterized protein BXZ73DRAFT_109533 [Epithele typhae]KAH9910119.1 hypothetical protein BXZ73DRAFT_109533 [Epithele typhae]